MKSILTVIASHATAAKKRLTLTVPILGTPIEAFFQLDVPLLRRVVAKGVLSKINKRNIRYHFEKHIGSHCFARDSRKKKGKLSAAGGGSRSSLLSCSCCGCHGAVPLSPGPIGSCSCFGAAPLAPPHRRQLLLQRCPSRPAPSAAALYSVQPISPGPIGSCSCFGALLLSPGPIGSCSLSGAAHLARPHRQQLLLRRCAPLARPHRQLLFLRRSPSRSAPSAAALYSAPYYSFTFFLGRPLSDFEKSKCEW